MAQKNSCPVCCEYPTKSNLFQDLYKCVGCGTWLKCNEALEFSTVTRLDVHSKIGIEIDRRDDIIDKARLEIQKLIDLAEVI